VGELSESFACGKSEKINAGKRGGKRERVRQRRSVKEKAGVELLKSWKLKTYLLEK